MKVKREIFYFEPGKYVLGDISNLFEEKDFKKMKGPISKLKAHSGFNKKFNLHFFKGIDRKFIDYIEDNSYIIAENCLVIVPDEMVKKGRLINCKRINPKTQFIIEYKSDQLGAVVYLKEIDAPGPFMMLVQENIINK
jgi:hypothetical protein